MGDISHPWLATPSGSRAQRALITEENYEYGYPNGSQDVSFYEQDDVLYTGDQYDQEEHAMTAQIYGTADLPPGALMSVKVPPAWSGTGSWLSDK